jgi:hypothetical protein
MNEVPRFKMIDAGPMAPLASAGPAIAQGRAAADLGRTISAIGEKGMAIAEKVRIEEEGGKASAFFLEVEKEAAAFNNDLMQRQDLDAWSSEFNTLASQHRAKIDGLGLSPEAKSRLQDRFAQWQAERGIRLESAVAGRKVAEARAMDGQALDHAARTSNFDMRDRILEGMEGRYPESEIFKVREETERLRDYKDAAELIKERPLEAESLFLDGRIRERFLHLDDASAEQLERLAYRESARAKGELWDNALNAALNEGEGHALLSKETLRSLAESGTITPDQRAGYLRAYHSPEAPEFDPHIYNEAFGAVAAYDPASDPTGATLATLRGNIATLDLPKEHVAELRDRLAERVKVENPTAHKLSGDFAKLNEEAFNSGRFGDWFSYTDHDNDPRTINRKVIDFPSYGRALAAKRRFTDTFDAWLRNQGDTLDPLKAQEVHAQLFERIVLDADDPTAAPLVPGAPPLIDFGRDVDSLLGNPSATPGAPPAGRETSATRGTFGGQQIQPPGVFYRNARPTIFGGKNDPADNGLSAFGGTTGDGGKQGVAIPLDVLKATFPGKDKAWFAANVKVAVKTQDGRQAVLPVADLGTAEWVWKRDRRPVLDLTEGAVKALGGRPIYKDGKLAGVSGLGSLSFALTTDNVGTEQDLRGMSWTDAQDAFFKDKKPTNADQIASGLAAVRSAWLAANLEDTQAGTTTRPEPEPWGDGSGGDTLPELDGPGVLPPMPEQ